MSLRDRKRARTRQALIDAATELFEQKGYVETTVADIAAAADIGTRTFFSYFASKEELLFPDGELRIQAAVDAIATRKPGELPAEVLVRVLREVSDESDEIVSPLASQRMRLMDSVPSVRGRALQLQLDAQRNIARELAAAFPDHLDEVRAAALTGAFMGAVAGALQVLLSDSEKVDPAKTRKALVEATTLALEPWLRKPSA